MKRSKIILTTISGLLITAFVALVVAKLFFISYSIVPQNGMYPGIPGGSLVFSWKRPYKQVSDVQRGDIVLFTRIENRERYSYIWRVVGLPGDKVEVDGETVSINGQAFKRERIRQDDDLVIFREVNGAANYEVAYPVNSDSSDQPKASLTVPNNELFVLGDNRFDAVDSRYFGAIKFDSIYGRKL
ncbi:MAG: signal peptidase I [Rubrivivax sp.]|nr:signal peptidase I [Pyrinomonadaceae bacterium]